MKAAPPGAQIALAMLPPAPGPHHAHPTLEIPGAGQHKPGPGGRAPPGGLQAHTGPGPGRGALDKPALPGSGLFAWGPRGLEFIGRAGFKQLAPADKQLQTPGHCFELRLAHPAAPAACERPRGPRAPRLAPVGPRAGVAHFNTLLAPVIQ